MASSGGAASAKQPSGGGRIFIILGAVAGFAGLGLLAWYIHNLPLKSHLHPMATHYAKQDRLRRSGTQIPAGPRRIAWR